MRTDRRAPIQRRGGTLKAVLVPAAIVVGILSYVGIAGSTGFCPTCTYLVNAVRGGAQSVVVASRNSPQLRKGEDSASSIKELVFTDLDGKSVPMEQYLGQPIVLDVWATWCAPCRTSRARLRSIAGEAAEYGTIVAVSVDSAGAEAVKEYIKTKEGGTSPFIEVMATDQRFRSVIAPFDRKPTIPKLVFINAKGDIVGIEYGVPKPNRVLNRMRALSTGRTKG